MFVTIEKTRKPTRLQLKQLEKQCPIVMTLTVPFGIREQTNQHNFFGTVEQSGFCFRSRFLFSANLESTTAIFPFRFVSDLVSLESNYTVSYECWWFCGVSPW